MLSSPRTSISKMPTKVITEPSICIPRTLYNVNWQTVKNTFEQILGQGTVDRVDLVPSRDGEPFCKIFVHMRYWPEHEEAIAIRNSLNAGEVVKIVYDTPYFWKCSASRVAKPNWETKSKPYVEFQKKKTEDPHVEVDDEKMLKHYSDVLDLEEREIAE